MQKLLLFVLVASYFAGFSQSASRAIDFPPLDGRQVYMAPKNKAHKSADSRAATVDLVLDYSGFDELYSSNIGFTYTPNIGQEINRNYPNTSNLTTRYIAVEFDTLMYQDQTSGAFKYIPKSQATLTLDSFDILYIHTNTTSTMDSIRFTVFNTSVATSTGYGTPTAVYNTPSIWDTLITTSTSLSANSQQFSFITCFPNITLPAGQSFGIRVDFVGDTANQFLIPVGYRDECGEACVAEVSYVGNNTSYYLNLTTGTGSNLSGYFENDGAGAIFYDCNSSGNFTPKACEDFFIQNARIISYVTADVNYGVTITSDSLRGCPNAQLNLSANAFGSGATPYTYAWGTSSGTLTSTSDEQTSLVIGTSNATVTVTVTDANNVTTSASVVVQSRGITVNITNANPLTIPCGSNATLITQTGGVQAGKNYSWSTGISDPTASTLQVDLPGTYTVTATNNVGCSATASVVVQYPGNLQNNIAFQLPAPPYCVGKELTFTNTSARQSGWTYRWTYGNGDESYGQTGVYTYPSQGFFDVRLQQDSAGCKFSSAKQSITVNQVCGPIGVEDVTFANGVNLMPNPANGNVTLKVEGAEGKLTMKVYNIIGSEVMNFSTTDATSSFNRTFDVSNLNNGTYLVKVQSGDKVAVKRLTVAK